MGRGRTRLCALLASALLACRNPISPGSEHLEAIELHLRDPAGARVAGTVDNARWTGAPLRVPSGDTLVLLAEFTDVFGAAFTLVGRREHTLRGEIEAPRMATWTTTDGRGRLVGLLAGTTRVRFHIWHGTHADCSSPWLEVVVTPRATFTSAVQ